MKNSIIIKGEKSQLKMGITWEPNIMVAFDLGQRKNIVIQERELIQIEDYITPLGAIQFKIIAETTEGVCTFRCADFTLIVNNEIEADFAFRIKSSD